MIIFIITIILLTEPNSQLDPDPEFIGTISNVTYPAGKEAMLTCSVRNLGKNKVSWRIFQKY